MFKEIRKSENLGGRKLEYSEILKRYYFLEYPKDIPLKYS